MTVTFLHTKETPKKQRFDAPAGGEIEGSLYVDKAKAGDRTELVITYELK